MRNQSSAMASAVLLTLAGLLPAPVLGQSAPPTNSPPIPYRRESTGRACILDGPSLRAGAVSFSRDGSTLYVGYEDGTIYRHEAITGWRMGRGVDTGLASIHALTISPDGQEFAFAAPGPRNFVSPGGDVVTIRRPVETEVGKLSQMRGQIIALAYSADGKSIGAIDHFYNIRVWHVDDRSELANSEDSLRADGRLKPEAGSQASFSSDLKRALIVNNSSMVFKEGSWDHLIRLWESGSKEQRIFGNRGGFESHPITCALISSDGSRFVESHEENSIFCHEFASGRTLQSRIPGARARGNDWTFLMLSPDNRRLVSATKRGAVLVDDFEDKLNGRQGFNGPSGSVRAAAFVPK